MGGLPADADRVIVLSNPKAGSRCGASAVGQLVALLRQAHYDVQALADADRLADQAMAAHELGRLRAIVAAGGDGTVGLVVNRTAPGVPIAILPLGTENLLSKYLGLSASPDAVFQAICRGRTTQIDAGRAGDRLFVLMLSCGFDAEVVRRLHTQRSGHIRHLAYVRPIVESMLRYEHRELRVSCRRDGTDGSVDPRPIVTHWAFVFNLPSYAVGLGIMPEANGEDGVLDVCTFWGGSVWHDLRHLAAVLLGRHRQGCNCVTTQATDIRIESEARVPYQLDGDFVGFLPVEIAVVPRRITLITPAEGLSG